MGDKPVPSFTKLNRRQIAFINKQKLFFVATAAREGRVNVSPKGLDTLRLVDETTLFWLNLSGSGNETAAHLRDTPRMTLMFCSFEGVPMILRVYGTAETVHPRDPEWETLIAEFADLAGSRQIFKMKVDLVQTSCGTGVPVMSYKKERAEKQLLPFYDDMGPDGVRDFWRRKNVTSIDGHDTGIFADGK